MNQAALLSFKLEQSLALAKRFPGAVENESPVASAISRYRAMPRWERGDLIDALPARSRRPREKLGAFAAGGHPEDGESSNWSLQFFNNHQPVEFRISSGHFQHLQFIPGFANSELAVRFDLHDTDRDKTDFARCIWFGLYDVGHAGANDSAPFDFRVVLTSDGEIDVQPFEMAAIQYRPSPGKSPARHLQGTIRIVVLHNRCEVRLDDGRRLYYGPVLADESHRRYGFIIQAIGLSGRIYPPTWESIADPR